MKARFASCFPCLLGALGLWATAGCSLIPEAKTDPTRFYVLSTSAAETRVTAAPDAPTIHLRPVELASYLRARPLIVRRGHNEIEFREFARWGESLDLGIGRVLREELLSRGTAGAVLSSTARREPGKRDLTLVVRVLACEGAANGTVDFRAIWELSSANPTADAASPVGGEFHPTDLQWDGKSEASLAGQLSQAVAGLAAEIAAAIKR